ncbi:MAG: Fe-S cluster assembly protein SufD [Hyphomicrobiales bacterium]
MNPAVEKTAAEASYIDAFDGDGLPTGPSWLDEARARAREAFVESGLPHRRIEEWKFTDLRGQLSAAYPPISEAPLVDAERLQALIAKTPFASIDAPRAVFADGVFRPELSNVDGTAALEFVSLAQSFEDAPEWVKENFGSEICRPDNALAALNTAFVTDGAAFRVTGDMDAPVELVFIHTSSATHTVTSRALIVVEDGASGSFLETHIGGSEQNYLSNIVTEIILGDGATINHVKAQVESADAVHLSDTSILLGADTTANSFTADTGAKISRNQVFVEFAGENSELNVSGAKILAGSQHSDTTLEVDHKVPHCTSRELFKLVLDENARGVFQGKVMVAPHAQKTDGKQMAQALLLSETAEFDAKPELEIFADDVVCGHGATAGELDEELLFYLRARGIPKKQAMALLINAFVGEAFDEVENSDVREALSVFAGEWLSRREGAG